MASEDHFPGIPPDVYREVAEDVARRRSEFPGRKVCMWIDFDSLLNLVVTMQYGIAFGLLSGLAKRNAEDLCAIFTEAVRSESSAGGKFLACARADIDARIDQAFLDIERELGDGDDDDDEEDEDQLHGELPQDSPNGTRLTRWAWRVAGRLFDWATR
jgi:hypothetical protein